MTCTEHFIEWLINRSDDEKIISLSSRNPGSPRAPPQWLMAQCRPRLASDPRYPRSLRVANAAGQLTLWASRPASLGYPLKSCFIRKHALGASIVCIGSLCPMMDGRDIDARLRSRHRMPRSGTVMVRPLERMNLRNRLAKWILCAGTAVGLLGIAGLLAASGATATWRDGAGAERTPLATPNQAAAHGVANSAVICRAVDLASTRECAPGSALGRAIPQLGEWLSAQLTAR